MVLLIVRGLLQRPSLSGTPTVTFSSVHIHNVWPKKRDASSELLQRLHGHMKQHKVDFTGGDFNMSAFSTVGDVFSIQSFQQLAIRFCGDKVRWKSRTVSAFSFTLCRSAHMSGVWIHTTATNAITPHLGLDLVIKPLTLLCFFISAPPTYLATTASCAVKMRKKEGLSADRTNTSVWRDDALDCDVACQSHESAHLFPSSPITCESLVSQLFHTTLTLGLLLKVFVFVFVFFPFFCFFLVTFYFFYFFFFSTPLDDSTRPLDNQHQLHAPQSTKNWRSGNLQHPGWRARWVGPGQCPQYTRAPKVGGGCG